MCTRRAIVLGLFLAGCIIEFALCPDIFPQAYAEEFFFADSLESDTDIALSLQTEAPKKPASDSSTPPTATPAPRPATPPTLPPQPARPVAPPQAPFANAPATPPTNQPFLARMSRAPDMFGDSFITSSMRFANQTTTDVPLGNRFKNEHNRAVPTDRVFFTYHHFHNAIALEKIGTAGKSDIDSMDQFTAGFEKTFLEGDASVELRMPFTATAGLATDTHSLQSGNVGNLVINLKAMLFNDDEQALSLGLATSCPTADDLDIVFDTPGRFTIDNRAVYLQPYLAYQATPTDDWFFHGFFGIDFAASPNRVTTPLAGLTAEVREQTLLFADLAAGYWFWRNDDDSWFSGAAGMLELHYSTALTRADVANFGQGTFVFGASNNRFDVLNMTVGSHVELTPAAALRTGFSFPLRNGDNRFFDAEFTAAVIYRY